jgi:hypothetical protein
MGNFGDNIGLIEEIKGASLRIFMMQALLLEGK